MKPSDLCVFVIGTNRSWGRGKTLLEARRNACNPKHYVALIAHPDSRVDEISGGFCYSEEFPPLEIVNTIPKKERMK